jgi:hypothetical protein
MGISQAGNAAKVYAAAMATIFARDGVFGPAPV